MTLEATSSVLVAVAEVNGNGENSQLLVYLIVGGIVLLFLCIGIVQCNALRKEYNHKIQQKRIVGLFQYLKAFDMDDIDIRRSPTGGINGEYLHGLAKGENNMDRSVRTVESHSTKSSASVSTSNETTTKLSKRALGV